MLVVLLFLSACGGKPSAAEQSILKDAFFYTDPRPTPVQIEYSNRDGEQVSALASPGQVRVVMRPNTTLKTMKFLLQSVGIDIETEDILSGIPALGIYLIKVSVGSEAAVIKMALAEYNVVDAAPNWEENVYQAPLVDLSDAEGPRKGKKLVPALLSSPDPTAKVILITIDNFSTSDHGEEVQNIVDRASGGEPSLRVTMGWGQVPRDVIDHALAAAIAGAEMNRQKVVINLSFGAVVETKNQALFNDDDLRNRWAEQEEVKSIEATLREMAASEWAKQGNVLVNLAAGNGAHLRNKDGYLVDGKPIVFGDEYKRLFNDSELGSLLRNNLLLHSALEPDGTLWRNSNVGFDTIFSVPPDGSERHLLFSPPGKRSRLPRLERQFRALIGADSPGSPDGRHSQPKHLRFLRSGPGRHETAVASLKPEAPISPPTVAATPPPTPTLTLSVVNNSDSSIKVRVEDAKSPPPFDLSQPYWGRVMWESGLGPRAQTQPMRVAVGDKYWVVITPQTWPPERPTDLRVAVIISQPGPYIVTLDGSSALLSEPGGPPAPPVAAPPPPTPTPTPTEATTLDGTYSVYVTVTEFGISYDFARILVDTASDQRILTVKGNVAYWPGSLVEDGSAVIDSSGTAQWPWVHSAIFSFGYHEIVIHFSPNPSTGEVTLTGTWTVTEGIAGFGTGTLTGERVR